ncbi:hypothetical protein BU15DRAFT_88313 [Melanogaster broomeanus]|nr:hypothetical protein BU15DRAFT_88313 [Melanogaster broomeanus]
MAYFARPQSSNSAVRIVNPAEQADDAKPLLKRDPALRQCRNILIYGSCRFQDKGCIYYHPPSDNSTNVARSESPVSVGLTAEALNAPVFVPKIGLNSFPALLLSTRCASPEYQDSASSAPYSPNHDEYDAYAQQSTNDSDHVGFLATSTCAMTGLVLKLSYSQMTQAEYDDTVTSMGSFYQSVQPPFLRQPLDYHLYTNPIPETFTPSHFMSDSVREDLQKRSEAIHSIPFPPYNLPDELQGYYSLVPLEPTLTDRRQFFSWFSTMYRATNANDGIAYALRRVENFRLMHQAAFEAIEAWSRVQHPNIVRVREAFTTRAFNDNSLVVSYDYHPNSQTLFDLYLRPKPSTLQQGRIAGPMNTIIPETTLWSYIIQIANAIRVAHEAGLAVRMVEPTKILLTGNNRLRINSCGIVDVLMYDTRQDIAAVQQEDLVMFGRLVFALCCGSLAALNTMPKALSMMGRIYSPDVKEFTLFLISKPSPYKVSSLVSREDRATDRLESELTSELENGRLVRLLCKFGFINERPEFAREPRWSETGDRYIIKLFRDYVFHQVDENGNPVVNLSHVLACLNKLDSGTDERIMLVSRDEQSCLVVSYKEVKSCIDAAFSDLSRVSQ